MSLFGDFFMERKFLNNKRKNLVLVLLAALFEITLFQNCRMTNLKQGANEQPVTVTSTNLPTIDGAGNSPDSTIESPIATSNPQIDSPNITNNPVSGPCSQMNLPIIANYPIADSPAADLPPVGMNITGIVYYGSQWVFVDLIKSSSSWISQNATGPSLWDTQYANSIVKDENDYPLELPVIVQGTPVPQILLTIIANSYHPAGEYTFLADGEGEVVFSGSGVTAKLVQPSLAGSSLTYKVTLQSPHGNVFAKIKSSVKGNHLRNMRFIMPGFLDSYQSEPFHPEFLLRLKGNKAFRYMDLMRTNDNEIKVASKRTSPLFRSQATAVGGLAFEYIAALANATGTDAWINIPHQADVQYITELATQLYCRLSKDRKIYVEFSNELWNGIFSQSNWLYKSGCEDQSTFVPFTSGNDWGVLGCNDGASGSRFHAKKLVQIYEIFKNIFGNDFDSRIVKVVASQAGNPATAKSVLEAFNEPSLNPNKIKPDALAIAPYFGGKLANQVYDECNVVANADTILREQCIGAKTLNNFLVEVNTAMETDSFERMRANKLLANQFGVKLIAYEGGQHLVGTSGRENSLALTNLLIAANRAPEMKSLYLKYYDYWFNNANVKGDLFMSFSFVVVPGKWGSWGVYETQDQDITSAPKAQALKEILMPGFKNVPQ